MNRKPEVELCIWEQPDGARGYHPKGARKPGLVVTPEQEKEVIEAVSTGWMAKENPICKVAGIAAVASMMFILSAFEVYGSKLFRLQTPLSPRPPMPVAEIALGLSIYTVTIVVASYCVFRAYKERKALISRLGLSIQVIAISPAAIAARMRTFRNYSTARWFFALGTVQAIWAAILLAWGLQNSSVFVGLASMFLWMSPMYFIMGYNWMPKRPRPAR